MSGAQIPQYGFPENDNHENFNGYDMVANSMKKEITNNDQLNHLKRFQTLNSEHFTHRDNQDVKKQFEKVKEVIDPTGNVSILYHFYFIYIHLGCILAWKPSARHPILNS
mgnify:CR=1 FL=1